MLFQLQFIYRKKKKIILKNEKPGFFIDDLTATTAKVFNNQIILETSDPTPPK